MMCFYEDLLLAWIVIQTAIHGVRSQLLAERSVGCQSNDMEVNLEFRGPFSGVVYAEKFFQSKECHWEGNGSGSMKFLVPLNTNPATQPYCGVTLQELPGEFTISLIISPIRNLLVEGMEKLTVRCLYNIGDVTLTLPAGVNGAGIFISPQTQGSVVTGSGGSPFLQMAIRDGHGIDGEIVQSATVGQRITLDVIMQDTTIYDFWLHDCYAHDGTNSPEASVAILDANGCVVRLARAVDPPVFDTSPTPNGAKHVYVHMYGFQFTTSQLVYFECQVRPCLQSCNRQQCTEPDNELGVAAVVRAKRQASGEISQYLSSFGTELGRPGAPSDGDAPDNYNLTAVIRIEPQTIEAYTPVARDDPGIEFAQVKSKLCVNTGVAVGLMIIFVVVCVTSVVIALFLCQKARKGEEGVLGVGLNKRRGLAPRRGAFAATSLSGDSSTSSYSQSDSHHSSHHRDNQRRGHQPSPDNSSSTTGRHRLTPADPPQMRVFGATGVRNNSTTKLF